VGVVVGCGLGKDPRVGISKDGLNSESGEPKTMKIGMIGRSVNESHASSRGEEKGAGRCSVRLIGTAAPERLLINSKRLSHPPLSAGTVKDEKYPPERVETKKKKKRRRRERGAPFFVLKLMKDGSSAEVYSFFGSMVKKKQPSGGGKGDTTIEW